MNLCSPFLIVDLLEVFLAQLLCVHVRVCVSAKQMSLFAACLRCLRVFPPLPLLYPQPIHLPAAPTQIYIVCTQALILISWQKTARTTHTHVSFEVKPQECGQMHLFLNRIKPLKLCSSILVCILKNSRQSIR